MLRPLSAKTIDELPHSAAFVTLLLNSRGVFYVADYGACRHSLDARAKMRTWEHCKTAVVSRQEAQQIANDIDRQP